MVVILTHEELAIGEYFGKLRHNKSESEGRRADWYEGNEEWNHIQGASGEVAVKKYFGLAQELTVDGFAKADFGSNVEVRTTSSTSFGLKIKHRDPDNRVVIALRPLRSLIEFKLYGFDILGWTRAGAAKREEWLADPGDRKKPAYFVPEKELLDITTIPLGDIRA